MLLFRGCAVASSVLVAAASSAADQGAGNRHAVRATAAVSLFDYGGLGVAYSGLLTPWLAAEAWATGLDLGNGRALLPEFMLRASNFDPNHVLSLGLGAGAHLGSRYGAVGLGIVELAYEYRPARGLSVFVGMGPTVVLNDSAVVPCTDSGWFSCWGDPEQYRRGDGHFRLRVGLGASF
jgi:hypothetical protein